MNKKLLEVTVDADALLGKSNLSISEVFTSITKFLDKAVNSDKSVEYMITTMHNNIPLVSSKVIDFDELVEEENNNLYYIPVLFKKRKDEDK